MTTKLLMGNEAFAHAALEAGAAVFAGYPGTPSSELIETVARLHASGRAHGVHVEWSTNEKAALEVCAAAAMAGQRALFTCKQVGLNVASDALMSLNYVGVRGGLVLFVADDPGPISSQTEQDTRRFAEFAKVPVFDPATPEQGVAMIKAAFDLSEEYHTPVIVRPTTRINHASTFFEIEDETFARPAPPGGFKRDPQRWVIFPKRSYQAHGEINERLSSMMRVFSLDPAYSQFFPAYLGTSSPDKQPYLGILTGGVSTQYALEALELISSLARRENIELPPYRLMQMGISFPFANRQARHFLDGLSHVLVLEELDHTLEDSLLIAAAGSFLSAHVHGKRTGEAPTRGENSTERMALAISKFFDAYSKEMRQKKPQTQTDAPRVNNPKEMRHSQMQMRRRQVTAARHKHPAAIKGATGEIEVITDVTGMVARVQNPNSREKTITLEQLVKETVGPKALLHYQGTLAPRPPILCAGCPHRGSFYAVKSALDKLGVRRDDATLCGDIGCYTLGNAMPLDAVDTCLCMGAGMTMAQGFQVVEPDRKQIAFIGDSTFFASGMTGVANAVYNNHDVTFAVLDNSTTAMTGSQPHPGTGVTLMGGTSEPIRIDDVLEALGVELILHADPLNHEQAERASMTAINYAGPSAIIFESPCVWLEPSGIPAEVDTDTCTGCKRCITDIGCPAITFNPDARGRKSGMRGQALIDTDMCNGCGLCTQICPFGAIDIPSMLDYAAREQGAIRVGTGIAKPVHPNKKRKDAAPSAIADVPQDDVEIEDIQEEQAEEIGSTLEPEEDVIAPDEEDVEQIERKDVSTKAKQRKEVGELSLDSLLDGTFTIHIEGVGSTESSTRNHSSSEESEGDRG